MGFWGEGNLQNDHVGDWVGNLIYSRNRLSFIEKSINLTFSVKGVREENIICKGLAAIEIISINQGAEPFDISEIPPRRIEIIESIELNDDIIELSLKSIEFISNKLEEWYFDDYLEDSISVEEAKKKFQEFMLNPIDDLKNRIESIRVN